MDDWLAEFERIGQRMHEHRVEAGGKSRDWNRLFDKMQGVYLVLRESPEGRSGLTRLALTSDCETVRSGAAARALFWDAAQVRPVLEVIASQPGLGALNARTVLQEFDAGRLHFDYGTPAG